MRQAIPITLTDQEQAALTTLSRSRTAPARSVTRAKIVLLAAAGRGNQEIAEELGLDRATVGKWRTRFADQRLPGIERARVLDLDRMRAQLEIVLGLLRIEDRHLVHVVEIVDARFDHCRPRDDALKIIMDWAGSARNG